MRKLILLSFITLDGVMQAPGGPEEDTSGGFEYGGWTTPYFDEFLGEEMTKQMSEPFDLVLGRKTFEIFASFWPKHPEEGKEINEATKYVASTTISEHSWQNCTFINKDIPHKMKNLKEQNGPNLQIHGSCELTQTLLQHDLIDELWLKIFPITLGQGKKIFDKGTIPAAFELTECKTSPKGVIVANFNRAGKVKTGSF